MAYFTYDVTVIFMQFKAFIKEDRLALVHHILSMTGIIIGIYYGNYMGAAGTTAFFTEYFSIFLNIRNMVTRLNF